MQLIKIPDCMKLITHDCIHYTDLITQVTLNKSYLIVRVSIILHKLLELINNMIIAILAENFIANFAHTTNMKPFLHLKIDLHHSTHTLN